MPPLPGFSDNAFRTRDDFVRASLALVNPLEVYKSSNNARVKTATSTGAGFSETAAQLEGFARPLWVVSNLLRSQTAPAHLETWIDGFRAGTDPQSLEYWGDLRSFDQRMVEMESIAYALLAHPQVFSFRDDETTKTNLIAWLKQINQHDMPGSNWLWFRVLVNLALVKVLDVPLTDVKHYIDDSLKTLDTFYLGNGWSSDGLWCDDRKQADYYSGSFAIQFAQLLYVKYVPEYDEIRATRYKEEAAAMAKTYWRYFGPSGAAIPFGRSLTYRFAFAAFWAAIIVAEVQLPSPLDQMGAVKGLLTRHLRWWAQHAHMFNTDGTLNIGYTYPNMYLAEDYNSPQSVYWCLKPFVILDIPESHPFWSSEELPYPDPGDVNVTELIWPPRHIMCNTSEHHFLLSSGQSTSKRFKAREAKYGKFAYSSSFGFSVPCGSFLEQIAPDSTLAVSSDDGREVWKVRWDPYNVERGRLQINDEEIPTLTSTWRPWKHETLTIETKLIPPARRWPGWHFRIHKVQWTPTANIKSILLVDGGFAASAQTSNDVSIFEQPVQRISNIHNGAQGWYKDELSALILSESGASGIADLTSNFITGKAGHPPEVGAGSLIIRSDPNTNLISRRSLIPVTQRTLLPNEEAARSPMEYTFVSGIFAIEALEGERPCDVHRMWHNRPQGHLKSGNIHFVV